MNRKANTEDPKVTWTVRVGAQAGDDSRRQLRALLLLLAETKENDQ